MLTSKLSSPPLENDALSADEIEESKAPSASDFLISKIKPASSLNSSINLNLNDKFAPVAPVAKNSKSVLPSWNIFSSSDVARNA